MPVWEKVLPHGSFPALFPSFSCFRTMDLATFCRVVNLFDLFFGSKQTTLNFKVIL